MSLISKIRRDIDIVSLIGSFTDIVKAGSNYKAKVNPLREESTSSLYIYPDTQKYYDFGNSNGGDVVDFIEALKGIDTKEAISFLQANNQIDNNSQYYAAPTSKKPIKKNDDVLIDNLTIKAKKYLSSKLPKPAKDKWSYLMLDLETYDNVQNISNTIYKDLGVVRVSLVYEKLFNGYILPTNEVYAKYLFDEVLGYDSYFDCPSIIIRDNTNRVVDIVRYRPHREGYSDMPKYLYTKSSEKPSNSYIFFLQAKVEELIYRESYTFVGEGLKNAINAYMMGIPFISIESTSNIKPQLIEYLLELQGITFVGAFDGDKAGERAYKKINSIIPMNNIFDFNSDKDFTEHIRSQICKTI